MVPVSIIKTPTMFKMILMASCPKVRAGAATQIQRGVAYTPRSRSG
jgi:hypothetical protein